MFTDTKWAASDHVRDIELCVTQFHVTVNSSTVQQCSLTRMTTSGTLNRRHYNHKFLTRTVWQPLIPHTHTVSHVTVHTQPWRCCRYWTATDWTPQRRLNTQPASNAHRWWTQNIQPPVLPTSSAKIPPFKTRPRCEKWSLPVFFNTTTCSSFFAARLGQ